MNIFVAGATGAIGTRLVPLLVERGHTVVGMTRTPGKVPELQRLGATAVVADALDRDAVAAAVAGSQPDVIVHQLTSLAGPMDMRNAGKFFATTNRLRTEGTDHLLAAGRAAGVSRVVAQSYAGWPFAREGGPIKDETAPLDSNPPEALVETLAAIRHVERAVTNLDWAVGVVLRYGSLYGPGTGMSKNPDGAMTKPVLQRQFPVVGSGAGVWSFVHVEDAASATVAAIERAPAGLYQVVDNEPAPVADWLPAFADALNARPPRRIPRWIGRIAAGEVATMFITELRGASNAKARKELNWELKYPSWRQGFIEGLG